jgi:hypothetical protein
MCITAMMMQLRLHRILVAVVVKSLLLLLTGRRW